MSNCKYCRQPADLLRSQHKACAAKYNQGWEEMTSLALEAVRDLAIERPLLLQLSQIAEASFMTDEHVRTALTQGWFTAMDEFLQDHLLTEQEEEKLIAFREQYQLPMNATMYPAGSDRLQKARALREIMDHRLPTYANVEGADVFSFQRNEKLLWVFKGVQYLESQTRRHYEGASTGASFRIAKGVYWRLGEFKGRPVDTTQTVSVGTGTLALTTKHIYFHSADRSFRIRHDKIVSIVPYSDGIVIQRDAVTAKPQTFLWADAWFLHNMVQNAPDLE